MFNVPLGNESTCKTNPPAGFRVHQNTEQGGCLKNSSSGRAITVPNRDESACGKERPGHPAEYPWAGGDGGVYEVFQEYVFGVFDVHGTNFQHCKP